MKENTCCFFGHRTINETKELKSKLVEIIEKLIADKKADTFLFGSKSRFNSLCLKLVTEIKEKYPHIKRIYVRAEYSDISEHYKTICWKLTRTHIILSISSALAESPTWNATTK